MKKLSYLGRFLIMGIIVGWFLARYALGRLRLVLGPRGDRRRAVAHLQGRLLRGLFAALGACFVKLGQVLSTRPDLLDPEIIDELRQLQDRMPPFATTRVRAILEAELGGRVEDHFAELDPAPVAAASVAQVHRGRLHAGLGGAEVAVKVLRPGVHAQVERDAAILVALARLVAVHPTWRLSDPVGHLRHFVAGILDQTNLRLELANYDLFRQHFAGTKGVRFPAVYPALSSERVMTMEFMRGVKVDALPPGDHVELAGRLQRVVLKMCFEDGLFHADLHPGNILVTEDGDICIFDVGLVKRLTDDVLLPFMDLTKCIAMGTPADFVTHLRKFHTYIGEVDWAALERDVTAFLARFRAQNIGELEIGALMNDMFALGRRYQVHPVPDLALVIIGLVTAEGIGKQLHPGNNLFADISRYLMPLLAQRGLDLASA
jgi:ubiquinone biosynthesis protein